MPSCRAASSDALPASMHAVTADAVCPQSQGPGNDYKIIARLLSGQAVELTPQGPVVLTHVERATVLRFPAGRRVHELSRAGSDV